MNTSSTTTIMTPPRKITSTQATPGIVKPRAQKLNGKSNGKSNGKLNRTSKGKSSAQKPHATKPTTQKSKALRKQVEDTVPKVGGTLTPTPKSCSRSSRPSSPHGIGQFARTLLATELSYDAIIARIRTAFPEAKTSVQCLRWYATKMREENVDMPTRPRKPRKAHSTADPT